MAEQVYLARLKPAVMNGLLRSIGFLGKAGADSIMARGIHNASLTGRIHSRRPNLLPTQNFCLQKRDGPYIHNPNGDDCIRMKRWFLRVQSSWLSYFSYSKLLRKTGFTIASILAAISSAGMRSGLWCQRRAAPKTAHAAVVAISDESIPGTIA